MRMIIRMTYGEDEHGSGHTDLKSRLGSFYSERYLASARGICPPELSSMIMIFSWVNPLERGPARKSKSWVGKAVEVCACDSSLFSQEERVEVGE